MSDRQAMRFCRLRRQTALRYPTNAKEITSRAPARTRSARLLP